MTTDHQLAIRLAADASELKRAQAEGAAGFEKLAAAGKEANGQMSAAAQAEAAARRAAAGALRAEQEAIRQSRVERNLLAQANRQLAMNMTDVVTSVASGMPLWMVAIQQGGQIRDAYGGILPAGRAVLGLMTPLAVGVGAVGAAMAATALAYNQGASEMQAYGRALAATNNAAGTTRSELAGIAREMAALRGTQAAAAEALAATVATGSVQNQNLRMVAEAALNLQRVGGGAMLDTVAKFAELGRSPVQASEKLNRELNYLTITVYDQIRALERQGKVAEAGALAQAEFAKATNRQAAELEQQLGAIERLWYGVGSAAKWAWDQMRDIGRPMTPQEELALLEKALEQPSRRGGDGVQAAKRREAQQARAAELRMQIYMEGEAAAAAQASAEAADRHIREAAQRDAEAKARTVARLQAAKESSAAEVAAYAAAGQLLQAYHGANLLSEQSYYAARRALIEANARAQISAINAENAVLAGQDLRGAEAIARDAAMASNRQRAAAIAAKAAADVGLANVQERLSLEALNRAQVEYQLTLERMGVQRARADGRALDGMRMGDGARSRAGREQAIADRYDADLDRLASDRFNGRIGEAQYQERLRMLGEFHAQALAQEAAYQAQRERLESDASVGLDRALANYAEQSRRSAEQTERAWTDTFKSLEDGAVSSAMGAKVSWGSLVESVVAGHIRMRLSAQLSGLFDSGLGAIRGWMGGAESGLGNGAAFGMGGVFHGGGKVGTDAPMAMRWMPASTWDHAPRFHSGRLASDEMAAILQKDESVLTPAQMRQLAPAGSGSTVALSLNVINQTGTPVQAAARQRSDGGIELLLTAAREAVAGDIASGSGPVTEALQGRFNLRPALA